MKCTALIVLACVAFEVRSQIVPGIGALGYGGVGGGLGYGGGMNSGYGGGGGYGSNQYTGGASGGMQQGGYGSGGGQAHNMGAHHHSLNSVTQVEDSGMHDIGASQGYNHGQGGGAGFNNYQSGLGTGGHQYGQGYNSMGGMGGMAGLGGLGLG